MVKPTEKKRNVKIRSRNVQIIWGNDWAARWMQLRHDFVIFLPLVLAVLKLPSSTNWNLVFHLRIPHQYHVRIIDVRELHTCWCSNHTLLYSWQLYTGKGARARTHTGTQILCVWAQEYKNRMSFRKKNWPSPRTYSFVECYVSQPGKNLSALGETYRLHLQVTLINYVRIHDQMQVQGKTTRILGGRIEEKGTERGNGQINQGRWQLKFCNSEGTNVHLCSISQTSAD
jgi:hypothetical protein